MGARGIRELDHRENDGIEVSLLWEQASNFVYVSVVDHHLHEACTQRVDPAAARDAFLHPYAYCSRGWRQSVADQPESRRRVPADDFQR